MFAKHVLILEIYTLKKLNCSLNDELVIIPNYNLHKMINTLEKEVKNVSRVKQ